MFVWPMPPCAVQLIWCTSSASGSQRSAFVLPAPPPPSLLFSSSRRSTLAQLDLKFRALHIYNSHVLDGTHIAAAYVDYVTSTLHLASNGGCRVVVATRDALGRSEVALELGLDLAADAAAASQQQPLPSGRPSVARAAGAAGLHASGGGLGDEGLASLPLSGGDVESIIIGSAGLWCTPAPH